MGNPRAAQAAAWSALEVDRPMHLLERRRMIGERAMISHITLFKGCDVPMHQHENEQFSVVISGRLRFTLGRPDAQGRSVVEIGPGEVIHLPSGLPHGALAVEETVVLDVFSPPSAVTGIDRPLPG
ncbi:MAG: cupin domain-containing protein [Phycisphaerales bacterium]|nr:cupin domain-containing protein [Phycisphaerales bacterium]